jgi:hypothetical protein
MNKAARAIVKLNLKNIRVPYLVTGIVVAANLAQLIIVDIILSVSGEGNETLSYGLFLWLLILLAPIFIPAYNFRRIFNLGGSRKSFFRGSLFTYVLLAAAVSLCNTVVYYVCDKLIVANVNDIAVIINLIEVFGWTGNGAVIAFFQQFAFLFWITAFVHTLTAAQDKWYGWAADLMIIIVLTVFIPIAPLRAGVAFFFYLIIFSAAPLQIAACLLIALAIYALNIPILARKAM